MKYKVIKGIKKKEEYKGLVYNITEYKNETITEFYICQNLKRKIFKKFYKYLGIKEIDEIIETTSLCKTDEDIKKYIDIQLKEFTNKLKNVEEYYSYYKQIQSQNARIRVSKWFDKGDYRHLAWLQEQKEKLEKTMKI